VTGRKRHLLVDTLGLLLKVVVHGADVQERDGGRLLLQAVHYFGPALPRMAKLWADAAYAGAFVDWVAATLGWTVEVVKRPAGQQGFQVLPRRWVVERTFGWLGRFRRLSKDYEDQVETSEALIYAAMSRLMLRRLARSPPSPSS
jgi:putative transposase